MFHHTWILNPAPQIFWGVRRRSGCNGVTAHQMSQIGAEASICHGTRNGMAVDAGRPLKDLLPFRDSVSYLRRSTLVLNPPVEFVACLYINAQQHLGMLSPAVLRALPQIKPGLARVNPHTIGVVRY